MKAKLWSFDFLRQANAHANVESKHTVEIVCSRLIHTSKGIQVTFLWLRMLETIYCLKEVHQLPNAIRLHHRLNVRLPIFCVAQSVGAR